jgi:Ni/Co efflux regulator RcnB
MLKITNHVLKTGLAAAIVATSFLATPIAAQAQSGVRADGSFQVADHRGGWRGHNRDWRRHHNNRHHGWRGGSRYYYRDNDNWGGAAAAGIIGLAAGAMIANSANQPRYYSGGYGGDYVSYCSNRYRSFNPRTGTYTGYDGYQHRCVMP